MVSKKAKRGKQPKMIVKSETLEWRQETDPDGQPAKLWRAKRPDGVTYTVEEDEIDDETHERGYFCEVDGVEDLGKPQLTLEAAKALCQWHADTELAWRLGDRIWTADTAERHIDPDDGSDLGPVVYAIEPEEGGELFYVMLYTEPQQAIGELPADSLEEAKERCQVHYREQHPPPQAESAEAPPKPAATPGQLPPPQRADWVIPMPLTEAEQAAAFGEGREHRREIRRLRGAVAASAERHKKLVKHNQELVDEYEKQLEELDEHMPERPVDCVRSFLRDGDEIWVQYTRFDGGKVTEILHERRLEQWEQRQLFGEGDPPPDKPPSATEPPPPDDEPADPPPATEPHPEPEAEPLTWRKITVEDDAGKRTIYVSGDPEGEHYRLDRIPQKADGDGLWHGLYFVAPGCCLSLPGEHVTLKAAKAEAEKHSSTRLRWETPPEGWGELLELSGRYQLRRLGDDRVKGQYVGPDESRDLGVHDDLWAAQVACQADADQRRAEA